jgi:hypothetical protein
MAARVTWLRPTTQTPSSAVHKLTLVLQAVCCYGLASAVQYDTYIPSNLRVRVCGSCGMTPC